MSPKRKPHHQRMTYQFDVYADDADTLEAALEFIEQDIGDLPGIVSDMPGFEDVELHIQ